jgi:hypothetical protein
LHEAGPQSVPEIVNLGPNLSTLELYLTWEFVSVVW